MQITIAILAGGSSSRMGADKALVPLAGVPMLQHIARTALHLHQPILILGRGAALRDWPADIPVEFLPDATMGEGGIPAGPMPALIAVLERTGSPILLLACDMPLLTPRTLQLLIDAHEAGAPHATMATSVEPGGTPYAEPTLAIYTPGILPTLRRFVITMKGAFQPLLRESNVRPWPVPKQHAHELLNVNTPEALAEAEKILRQRASLSV
jgi:molybdopterin-guanine dinucleotide biosynthesis protein A